MLASEGFDLLLDNLPVGVYRVEPGPEGRVTYANSSQGVEREDQLANLRKLECGLALGFLFSRPVSAENATQLLENFVGSQVGGVEIPGGNIQ